MKTIIKQSLDTLKNPLKLTGVVLVIAVLLVLSSVAVKNLYLANEQQARGGAALRSAEGQYGLAVRNSLKEVWAKDFPQILKETKNMSKWFSRGKLARKILLYGSIAAGGIGGGKYLFDVFTGKAE